MSIKKYVNLKVKNYLQPPHSVECGPYCLKMIYNYYGKRKSIEKIIDECDLDAGGTFPQALGNSLLKNGFEVKLYYPGSKFLSYNYNKMEKDRLIAELRRRDAVSKDRDHKKKLRQTIGFIEAGGKLKVEVPTLKGITAEIKEKRPVILNVQPGALYKDGLIQKGYGHYVLAQGFDKNSVIINDPDNTPGIKKYPKNDVIYALYSWGGATLFAKPKYQHGRRKEK